MLKKIVSAELLCSVFFRSTEIAVKNQDTILFFGDSITFSGNTYSSGGILRRARGWFRDARFQFLLHCGGTNDVRLILNPARQVIR